MKAVILAAGLGSRLGPLTRDVPKAAINVAGAPPIRRAIQFARLADVSEIQVVGGFHSHHVWALIEGEADVIRIENPDYVKGNFYTLACVRGRLAVGGVLPFCRAVAAPRRAKFSGAPVNRISGRDRTGALPATHVGAQPARRGA